LFLQAGVVWKNHGHGPEDIVKLMKEMQMYKAGRAPFNLAVSAKGFDPRLYWQSLRIEQYKNLPSLSLIIFNIVPHAGDFERVFSMMG
jgi:hypothetical protein